MKKKVGTILDEDILMEVKERALREGRPLSELFQDALSAYLYGKAPRGDAERSCKLFCSHRTRLALEEIDDLLEEDVLAI